MRLLDSNAGLIETTSTIESPADVDGDGQLDPVGSYFFDELDPGNYFVQFELPDGHFFTQEVLLGAGVKES